jgi:hypothetical protein
LGYVLNVQVVDNRGKVDVGFEFVVGLMLRGVMFSLFERGDGGGDAGPARR